MAYKCIRSNYSKRLFEEGQIYDQIGSAQKKFFEEIPAAGPKDVVVETGLPDPVREEVIEALNAFEVAFDEELETEKLQELLQGAQEAALTL